MRNHIGRAEGRHEADVGGIGHLQEARKLSQSALSGYAVDNLGENLASFLSGF